MTATNSPANPSRDSTGLLGLREVSAALDRWQSRPGPDAHAQLAEAFARVVSSSGLGGGHLHLDVPPLTEVELRVGTLTDQAIESAGLRTYQLRFGDRALATLQLDAPPAAVFWVDECARGLEIVIGAAWSRARAGQASDELAAMDTATRGIAGILDLDRVLQLITDRVRELAHAQYAALGIVDPDGGIERFITSGVNRADRERIGAPPHGHGLLGVIAREVHPVRVHDIAHDPRRYGFPPNHPPMHSLLGVPIGAKGRSIGRLYLTNKLPSGDFTEDDERLVEMFALHAGIAIENARLHERSSDWRSSRSARGSAAISMTASSRASTRSASRSRTFRTSWRTSRRLQRRESSGLSTRSINRSGTFATSSSVCARSCSSKPVLSVAWPH